MPSEMAHNTSPASSDAPCDEPASTDCCIVIAPCTITFASARAAEAATPALRHGRIADPTTSLAASAVTAPDPPPPKA